MLNVNAQTPLLVRYDGSVRWFPIVNYQAACEMHLRYFPFDVQSCWLNLGPWSHRNNELEIIPDQVHANLTEYEANPAWHLDENNTFIEVRRITDEWGTWNFVYYHFILIRNPNKYVMNILIPVIIYTILCMFTFSVPINSGSRLELTLAILISVSVYQILVADYVPKATDEIPMLTTFLTILSILIIVATIFTIFNIKLYQELAENTAPEWCLDLVLFKVGRFLLFDYKYHIAKLVVKSEAHRLHLKYLEEHSDELDRIKTKFKEIDTESEIPNSRKQKIIQGNQTFIDQLYESYIRGKVDPEEGIRARELVINQKAWNLITVFMDRICTILYLQRCTNNGSNVI